MLEDVYTKDVVMKVNAVDAQTKLTATIPALAKTGALPVTDGGTLAGLLFLEEVAQRQYPAETKTITATRKVPTIHKDSTLQDAAALLVNNKLRALPVVDEKKVAGIISETQILEELTGQLQFNSAEAMSEILTLEQKVTVGKALALMRQSGAEVGAIVDGEELVGTVEWRDFLILERPKQALGRRDWAGDYLQDSKMPITNLMESKPVTVYRGDSINEAIKKMLKAGTNYAVVLDNKIPVGILTAHAILARAVATAPREGLYVQITGAEGLDVFEKSKLHENIDEVARKLSKIFVGDQSLHVHVKTHSSAGEKKKHSVHFRFVTPVDTFRAEAAGWNLATVTDEAADNLERIVKEQHKKSRKKQREGSRSLRGK